MGWAVWSCRAPSRMANASCTLGERRAMGDALPGPPERRAMLALPLKLGEVGLLWHGKR